MTVIIAEIAAPPKTGKAQVTRLRRSATRRLAR